MRVSLRSGKACADALERTGYKVSRVDVNRDIAATLRALKPDAALNVLHGCPVKTHVAGDARDLGIPYSHSGVLPSALAKQKEIAKTCSRPQAFLCRAVVPRQGSGNVHLLPLPYAVKPAAEGSARRFPCREYVQYPPQGFTICPGTGLSASSLLAEP